MMRKTLSATDTLRKFWWLAAICVLAILWASLTPAGALDAAAPTDQYIGEARAKSLALTHAGVTESQATFLKVHLDYDDRRVVYDVEFYSGSTEYDYEIDALDGRVLESDMDIEYYSIPGAGSTTTNAGQYIGETQARTIALAHAKVTETQATFIKTYLDYDDRRVVYDVEFYSGDTEYDYEIDAVSGTIVESDMEIEYYTIPNNGAAAANRPTIPAYDAANFIGDAQAKSVALTHAGTTESQATFTRVRLDYDDGRVDYEVDFFVGDTEYEYEIDAVSGTILEFDRETRRAYNGNTGAGTAGQTAGQQSTATAANYIGDARAQSIALTDAGLTESQVRRLKVKLDREHRQMVYEVEFRSGLMEYEYEIDAVSGAIIESDMEYDD